MSRSTMTLFLLPLIGIALALSLCLGFVDAAETIQSRPKIEWHYYKVHNTCHDAEVYIRHQVKLFWDKDKSITPKLLRLVSSDCLVNGCDASILLDGPSSEKTASQNSGLGGFVIIDKIKAVLEERCPGVVSCADILHLATRDALKLAGAPAYPVFAGRRDGVTSDARSVDLPSPSISWQEALAYFKSKGLDVLDMSTLLGAHSMGRSRCRYIVDRLYNFKGTGKPDPSMDATFLAEMTKLCPQRKKGEPDPLVYLNPESGSNFNFTETYYKRVLSRKAVLGVDQQLLYGDNQTKEIIEEFAAGFEDLRRSFSLSMSRMGNIKVLTGNQGEIRRNCRRTNNGNPN